MPEPISTTLVVAGVIAGIGGLTNIIGSYISGEISQDQFDREMVFREKQLNAQLDAQAKELGLRRDQLKQHWDVFVKNLSQRKEEFASTFGLAKEKFGFEKEAFKETIGLQKEALKHRKYMDIINPIMEKKQRAKNVITAFSGMARNPLLQKPATPANPLIQGGQHAA